MDTTGQRFSGVQFGIRHLALLVMLVAFAVFWGYSPVQSGIVRSGEDLDVAILGRGYFQVSNPIDGQFVYTRHGGLTTNANSQLTFRHLENDWLLQPSITLPMDWTAINIGLDGTVLAQQTGADSASNIGQIQLASFASDTGLHELLPGVFQETDKSGTVVLGSPGQSGFGYIKQGWVESLPGQSTWGWSNALSISAAVFAALAFFEVRQIRKQLAVLADRR